jgi:hypothetical protein
MPSTFTYRNAIHQYLDKGNMPWSKLGIDILLGAKTDAVMTNTEQAFLPDNLMLALDSCSNTKMVANASQLYILEKKETEKTFFTPMLCSLALLLLYLLLHFKKLPFKPAQTLSASMQTVTKHFDFTLFFIVGMLGILLIFMWWGTDHTMTKNNFNLLWASPLFVVYAFVLGKKTNTIKTFSFCAAIFLGFLLCSWFFLPEQLNVALIPIVILLAWRLLDNSERFLKS